MGEKTHADTSWLVALFDSEDPHHNRALKELDELKSPPSVSAIALAELLVNFEKSDLVDVQATLSQIQRIFTRVIDLDVKIATLAAEIRSQNRITLGESVIVASAKLENAALLTFDKSMKAVHERIR